MKKLFVIIFIFITSFSVNAEQPIFSTDLNTINYDVSTLPPGAEQLTGGWYINYIGMPYIYQKGIDLTPNFFVGVLDSGIAPDHENLDELLITDISSTYNLQNIPNTGKHTGHGNMVTALFSAAKELPARGGRSIIRANTIFQSYYDNSMIVAGNDTGYINYQLEKLSNYSSNLRIISGSIGPNAPSDYPTGKILSELQSTRDVIINHPNILYVLSAGNEKDYTGKRGNGALHYKFNGNYETATQEERENENNYIYSELKNLIVVAANDNNGILYEYSNYGKGVDIAAPSQVFGIWCYDEVNESNYLEYEGTQNEAYGYSRSDTENIIHNLLDSLVDFIIPEAGEDTVDFSIPCQDINSVANGTSTAQPIVAGTAGVLLSNDETLTSFELKKYLVKAPLLSKTSTRYKRNFLNKDAVELFLPECPELPILNIETSMKWYEEEHNEKIDIISDDFNSVGINQDNWLVVRHNRNYVNMPTDYSAVSINNGVLYLKQDRIDDGPQIHSIPIAVTNSTLTIQRRTKVSYANNNYRGRFFILTSKSDVLNGDWFEEGEKTLCAVTYDHDRWLQPDNRFVFGNNWIPPIWDEFFTEELNYNMQTGQATYKINGNIYESQFDIPDTGFIKVMFDTFGWFTGHESWFDYINIFVTPN